MEAEHPSRFNIFCHLCRSFSGIALHLAALVSQANLRHFSLFSIEQFPHSNMKTPCFPMVMVYSGYCIPLIFCNIRFVCKNMVNFFYVFEVASKWHVVNDHRDFLRFFVFLPLSKKALIYKVHYYLSHQQIIFPWAVDFCFSFKVTIGLLTEYMVNVHWIINYLSNIFELFTKDLY